MMLAPSPSPDDITPTIDDLRIDSPEADAPGTCVLNIEPHSCDSHGDLEPARSDRHRKRRAPAGNSPPKARLRGMC